MWLKEVVATKPHARFFGQDRGDMTVLSVDAFRTATGISPLMRQGSKFSMNIKKPLDAASIMSRNMWAGPFSAHSGGKRELL